MMTCLFWAILGGVIASLLYELVFPPVIRRRPPVLSPEVRRRRAERRNRGVLNDETTNDD
jgi:hypothetical protein